MRRKRTWDEIDTAVLKAIAHLENLNRPTTVSNLHGYVGTGVKETTLGNTENLLRRMARHGLVEETEKLEWVMTLIGDAKYKEIKDSERRARKYIPPSPPL